jgi:hypothetical protein
MIELFNVARSIQFFVPPSPLPSPSLTSAPQQQQEAAAAAAPPAEIYFPRIITATKRTVIQFILRNCNFSDVQSSLVSAGEAFRSRASKPDVSRLHRLQFVNNEVKMV